MKLCSHSFVNTNMIEKSCWASLYNAICLKLLLLFLTWIFQKKRFIHLMNIFPFLQHLVSTGCDLIKTRISNEPSAPFQNAKWMTLLPHDYLWIGDLQLATWCHCKLIMAAKWYLGSVITTNDLGVMPLSGKSQALILCDLRFVTLFPWKSSIKRWCV